MKNIEKKVTKKPVAPTERGNGRSSRSAADVDRTSNDAGADVFNLGLQRCRNSTVKAVIRGKANTVIGQCANHHTAIKLAVHGLFDDLHHCRIHALENRCQIDIGIARIGLCLVSIHADDLQRIGAKLGSKGS